MGFLDNSGDIILDAVLTDVGRKRLAQGDGSFKISKFALGDDEIDYSLYSGSDPRGSAYYDIEILQTPVFEAFTNNLASLNSRLVTMARNDLLYLPVMKLNNLSPAYQTANENIIKKGFILTADEKTSTEVFDNKIKYNSSDLTTTGIINGVLTDKPRAIIRVDQGIDNTAIPAIKQLSPDLTETAYMVEVDSRLLTIKEESNGIPAQPSYIDDDYIATYYFNIEAVGDTRGFVGVNTNLKDDSSQQVIAGERGSILHFSLGAADDIRYGTYLFDTMGKEIKDKVQVKSGTSYAQPGSFKSIQTSIMITGVNTGYFIEVPVVIFKYIS